MGYDTDHFQQDVIERSHTMPVVVDFWAEWCGPCKVIGPILERLAEQYRDDWALVKLNTELPDDGVKDRYMKAIEHLKSNDIEAALEGFIDVIRRNRYYDEDGSRKACIGIFKFLGESHEFTRKHRSAFSSALHA